MGFQQKNTQTYKMSQFIEVDSFMLQIVPPATGVQFYKDGIIYVSSSKSDGICYPDIFHSEQPYHVCSLNKGVLENPQLFSPSVNFTCPTEAFTFSTDFKTLYFTKISENDALKRSTRLSSLREPEIRVIGQWMKILWVFVRVSQSIHTLLYQQMGKLWFLLQIVRDLLEGRIFSWLRTLREHGLNL